MAVEITSINDLDATLIEQNKEYTQARVLEQHPNIDLRRGPVNDLVINLHAIMGAVWATNMNRQRQSGSLLAIEQDPTLADEDIVDAVLSNWGVTRREAVAARGEMTIVLNQLVAFTVAAGEVFVAEGQRYITETPFAGRTRADNVLLETDREIKQIANDQWAFTIEVVAEEAGSAGMIKKDTAMVPINTTTAFERAYATDDFTGGVDEATNTELLTQLEEGQAAKTFSNRVTTSAMVKYKDTRFANIQGLSIVGLDDTEMIRDQHWLFPVSGGGRSDIYLRAQALPQSTTLTKTATLIQKTAEGGIWQFSLMRDDAPGFYEIRKIRLPSNPDDEVGYEVTEDIRGLDVTGDIYIPDVANALEGTYSRYQAATIRFLDTDTDTDALTVNSSTQDYELAAIAMPLIAELQEFIGERDTGNPVGDNLVKGAVPCFLSLNFTIERRRTDATIDTDAIKEALLVEVNNTLFPGKLYASELTRVVDSFLPSRVSVGNIDMFGRIRRPDGTNRYIRSDDVLTVPDDYSLFSTGRTVCFFLETADIGISVADVDVKAV